MGTVSVISYNHAIISLSYLQYKNYGTVFNNKRILLTRLAIGGTGGRAAGRERRGAGHGRLASLTSAASSPCSTSSCYKNSHIQVYKPFHKNIIFFSQRKIYAYFSLRAWGSQPQGGGRGGTASGNNAARVGRGGGANDGSGPTQSRNYREENTYLT